MIILYKLLIVTGIGLCFCWSCHSLISVGNVGGRCFKFGVGCRYFVSVDKINRIFYCYLNKEILRVQYFLY